MLGGEHWPSAPPLPRDYWSPETVGATRVASRWSWVAPVVVTTALLALYASTVCRSVFWYDSAEFATAAKVWGVPHPPGYPAYVLVSHILTMLPFSPALIVNVFSAVTMACAMGLLTTLGQQLGTRPLYAAMSAFLLGTSDLVWANATVAEVYGPGLCFALGILVLLVSALRSRRIGLVWCACWLAGFGLGAHYFLATLGLGYALLLVHVARRVRPNYGDYVVAAAMFAFGATVFVLLPLRAALGAALNFGDPRTWEQFVWVITGGTYGQFFDAPTLERAWWFATLIVSTLTPPGAAFSGIGAIVALRLLRRPEWSAVVLAMVGNVVAFLPYGVHDPEVFLLPALVLLATFVGAAAEWLHLRLGEMEFGRLTLSYLVPGLLSAMITYRAVRAYPERDLSRFHAADDYAQTLIEQLPLGAFIANFTTPPEWQYDAVFTYYKLVLGARPDVTKVQLPERSLLIDMLLAELPVYVYTPTSEVVLPPFVLSTDRDLIRLGLDGTQHLYLPSFDPEPSAVPSFVAPPGLSVVTEPTSEPAGHQAP